MIVNSQAPMFPIIVALALLALMFGLRRKSGSRQPVLIVDTIEASASVSSTNRPFDVSTILWSKPFTVRLSSGTRRTDLDVDENSLVFVRSSNFLCHFKPDGELMVKARYDPTDNGSMVYVDDLASWFVCIDNTYIQWSGSKPYYGRTFRSWKDLEVAAVLHSGLAYVRIDGDWRPARYVGGLCWYDFH